MQHTRISRHSTKCPNQCRAAQTAHPQTSLPDQHTHSLQTHQQLVYKKLPELLLEPVQGPMNQVSSLVVSRAEATVEEVPIEKMTLRGARTKQKSSELYDSESSDETSDLYTISKVSLGQLARKISSLKKTVSKPVKLIDVKFQGVGSRGGQVTDRYLRRAFKMRETGTPCWNPAFLQVLFQTEQSAPALTASSAPVSVAESNFYSMWKGW